MNEALLEELIVHTPNQEIPSLLWNPKVHNYRVYITSETSVNFYQTTRRYNLEDSHLRSCCRENLKSYNLFSSVLIELNCVKGTAKVRRVCYFVFLCLAVRPAGTPFMSV
jgi:hypothetical protein